MKSMKGRSGTIQRCSQLGLRKEKKTKMCGLSCLPEDVVRKCLVQLSRMDLAALAMTSKAHRSLATSPSLWDLRWRMKCIEPSYYVCLHIFPERVPQWFILHPVTRQLKHILSFWTPEPASSYVVVDWGIFIIGGLVRGKPTTNVSMLDCFEHGWYDIPPMKMPRAFASAIRIENKIYVFGGCGDDIDSSNWAEVYDIRTATWDFLCVPTTARPKNIKQSVLIDKKEYYAVDEDRQIFSFSPSKLPPMYGGKTDSKPGDRDDWCLIGECLFSRGAHGTILWCLPYELDWKEVKGLEELQQHNFCKLSRNYACNIVLYWNAQPHELWSAEISLTKIESSQGLLEVRGKIEWSGSVYKLDYPLTDSNRVKVLFAASVSA